MTAQIIEPEFIELALPSATAGAWSWGDSAQPLVVVHGFGGSGLDAEILKAHLPAGLSIFAPDLPGHGRSQIPAPDVDGLEHSLGILDALIDRAGIATFDLLGYSMGGRVALRWAQRRPQGLRRLILVGATAGLEAEESRSERRGWDQEMATLARTMPPGEFADMWAQLPLMQSQISVPEPWRSRMRARRRENRGEGLAWAMETLGSGTMPHIWDRLESIAAPTLIVAGESDSRYREIASRLSAGIPQNEVSIISGAGHAPHVEQPGRFSECLKVFLGSC